MLSTAPIPLASFSLAQAGEAAIDTSILWPNLVAMAALAAVLIAAAVTDVRTGTIPNKLTLPAIAAGFFFWAVAGLVFAGAEGAMQAGGNALLGIAVGFVPFALIYAAGGLGGGDIKLITAVGAISASWQCVLATAFYGFLVAGAIAIVVMIRKGLVRRTMRRLFSATLFAASRTAPPTADDSPRIPLAVGLAAGGLLAGAEYLLAVPMPWPGFTTG